MNGATTAVLFQKVLDATSKEGGNFRKALRELASHPINLIATFFTAPFLLFRIAKNVENPTRRKIAIVGITLSIVLAYAAGTFLGTFAGAALVSAKIGFLFGIAFLIGTTLSVFLSVVFSLVVLNSVSYIFLKMSAQEVIDHLNKISS